MLAQRVAQLDALLSHLGLLAQQQNGTNNNTNGNQVWFPREAQILMTIIAYINILIFIIVSVAMLIIYKLKPQLAKKRSALYVVLSCLGLVVMFHDSITNIWVWEAPDEWIWIRITWIFYFLGFPMVFAPIIVRSWRVVCMYKQTPNCFFRGWDKRLATAKRDDKWVLIRIVALIVPYLLLFPFVFASEYVDIGLIPLQFVLLAINLILAIVQFSFRQQLKEKHMNQYRSLIVFNIILIIYYVYDNIAYYILMRIFNIYLWPQVFYFIWYNVLFVFLIWDIVFTAGKEHVREIQEKMKNDEHSDTDDEGTNKQNQRKSSTADAVEVKLGTGDDYEDYFSNNTGDRLVMVQPQQGVSPSLPYSQEEPSPLRQAMQ